MPFNGGEVVEKYFEIKTDITLALGTTLSRNILHCGTVQLWASDPGAENVSLLEGRKEMDCEVGKHPQSALLYTYPH